MCDCYTAHCAECKIAIPVHIGDFSVGREQVLVFCPDCQTAAWQALEPIHSTDACHIVFTNRITEEDCEDDSMPPRWIGRCVVFVVTMPRGVHTN
jgi:hypothetical protein